MEHLQAVVESSPDEDLMAPDTVIEAICTLTRAGLLSWTKSGSTQFTQLGLHFDLSALNLDHFNVANDEEEGGYSMEITVEQSTAIREAIVKAEQEYTAVKTRT
jgi:hypothetical protein